MKDNFKKIFNENLYTDFNINNIEIYKYINMLLSTTITMCDEELRDNKELISLYNKFINEVKNLLEILKIPNNDLGKAIAINLLIHAGVFSYNNQFKIKNNVKELHCFLGINVISGNACCRHLSAFYEDIFKNAYQYPLIYWRHLSHFKNNFISKNAIGNHVINLVIYHDKLLGIDLLNNDFYYPENQFQMNCLEKYRRSYLRYKPANEIICHKDTLYDIKDKLLFLDNYSKKESIDFDEIKKIYHEMIIFLKNKKEIYSSFSYDNNYLKKEIKEKILSIKG